MDSQPSQVSTFYAGRNVLITGGTGFIGKVLIEKLLRSCPEINKIYLLIRPAHGKNVDERLKELAEQHPLSFNLKSDLITTKLHAITSDLSLKGLGLSETDRNLLIDNVSVIFHIAASVKFEASFEYNMRHNVLATRELLKFASDFKKLDAFIHVSTAYSNCHLNKIDERVYKVDLNQHNEFLEQLELTRKLSLVDSVNSNLMNDRNDDLNHNDLNNNENNNINNSSANRIVPNQKQNDKSKHVDGKVVTNQNKLQLVKNCDNNIINGGIKLSVVTQTGNNGVAVGTGDGGSKIVQTDCSKQSNKKNNNCEHQHSVIQFEGRPNTYTYTKAIAENIVHQYSKKMNVAIVRPSIVMSAMREPAEGWVDSINGPVGLSVVGALGILQTIDVNSQVVFDLIPVDLVSNAIISVAWAITKHRDEFKTNVFNLTTGNDNPCSFYQYFHAGREAACEMPSSRTLRPLLHIPLQKGMHPIKYTIRKLISHLLFAYLIDMILSLCGKKRLVVRAVNKMHHANRIFEYFCSNQWSFETKNMAKIQSLFNDDDRITFNCNVKSIDWKHYSTVSWLGCRRYILKEDDSTFDEARQRYIRVCRAYLAFKIICALLLTYFIIQFAPVSTITTIALATSYSVLYML